MKQTAVIGIIVLMSGCTKQEMAKEWGGKTEIRLDVGQRIINVTWKDTDMWILLKENQTTPASTYLFKESSTYGIMNGEVRIVEQ